FHFRANRYRLRTAVFSHRLVRSRHPCVDFWCNGRGYGSTCLQGDKILFYRLLVYVDKLYIHDLLSIDRLRELSNRYHHFPRIYTTHCHALYSAAMAWHHWCVAGTSSCRRNCSADHLDFC